MILRKIQLKDENEYGLLPNFFNNKLMLWFDGFKEEDVEKLDKFFLENYHLKYEDNNIKQGIITTEYANNSLYDFNVKGNLYEYYKKELKLTGLRKLIIDHKESIEKDPAKHEEDIKEYFRKKTEMENRSLYFEDLEKYLKDGSSLVLSVIKDFGSINYGSRHMDAPYDYGNPEFQLNMAKISMMPVKYDVLRELTGLLVGQGLDYETKRHKDIYQGIISENIKKYEGHAYYENKGKVA